jgi:biotin synthase
MTQLRHDWAHDEIRQIFTLPLPELIFQAQRAHREFHRPDEIQLCRLLSIKTGGCPEDCAYCSQSAHYRTGVAREELLNPREVVQAA